jgi:hypothetical protein
MRKEEVRRKLEMFLGNLDRVVVFPRDVQSSGDVPYQRT